jgi:WD40 repeat protein
MIFNRECDDLSLGTVATFKGYQFIALTGSPSTPNLNTKSLRIYDHQTGQITFDQTLPDHILTIRLGQDVIAAAMHCKIELWSITRKQVLHTFSTGLNVHCPIALSANSSNLVIAGSSGRQVTLHRGLGGSLSSSSFIADENSVSIVEFADDSSLFATAGFNGSVIRVWDFRTLSCVAILDRGSPIDLVQTVNISPAREFLAACSKEGIVKVFDIRNRVQNAMKPTPLLCSVSLGQKVFMPRICWLTANLIGVTTLEGDYYEVGFNDSILKVKKTPFLKAEG